MIASLRHLLDILVDRRMDIVALLRGDHGRHPSAMFCGLIGMPIYPFLPRLILEHHFESVYTDLLRSVDESRIFCFLFCSSICLYLSSVLFPRNSFK